MRVGRARAAETGDWIIPELPEVETVRRGLAPAMVGARFDGVLVNRPDLRFPFPAGFADRLEKSRVDALDRRGKYLLAHLSTGETLIAHLGMSGRFLVGEASAGAAAFVHAPIAAQRHDHVVFRMSSGADITYNDARRFGFMDLVKTGELDGSRHFAGMGPEPLGPDFTLAAFEARLSGRLSPIKTALLDQHIVAGLGNIYVCEALFRAGLSPQRKAASVPGKRAARLHRAIIDVLSEAVDAGGSSIRDFAASDGSLGYFQHGFAVYGREGEACVRCRTPISRLVQGGRSTFFCGRCQR